MIHCLHSPLKALFNASYVTSVLLLTLAAPADAMFQPEDDFKPTSISSTSSSMAIPPAVQPCAIEPTEVELRVQRKLDQMPPETSRLDIPYMSLGHLPNLNRFTRLTTLNINSDEFTNVDVTAHPCLEELNLYGTSIDSPTRIIGLDQLTNLRGLSLIGCPLKNLDGISACPSLEIVCLTDTSLTSLTEIEDLTHLRELYVFNCPLDNESRQVIDRLRARSVYVHDSVAPELLRSTYIRLSSID